MILGIKQTSIFENSNFEIQFQIFSAQFFSLPSKRSENAFKLTGIGTTKYFPHETQLRSIIAVMTAAHRVVITELSNKQKQIELRPDDSVYEPKKVGGQRFQLKRLPDNA